MSLSTGILQWLSLYGASRVGRLWATNGKHTSVYFKQSILKGEINKAAGFCHCTPILYVYIHSRGVISWQCVISTPYSDPEQLHIFMILYLYSGTIHIFLFSCDRVFLFSLRLQVVCTRNVVVAWSCLSIRLLQHSSLACSNVNVLYLFIQQSEHVPCIRTNIAPSLSLLSDALDALGLKRYCCRRMLLSHVDLIEKLLNYAPLEKWWKDSLGLWLA